MQNKIKHNIGALMLITPVVFLGLFICANIIQMMGWAYFLWMIGSILFVGIWLGVAFYLMDI